MKIKENWRELILITLGILVMVAPFAVSALFLGWVCVVLGIAVIVVGTWPLIVKRGEIVIGE